MYYIYTDTFTSIFLFPYIRKYKLILIPIISIHYMVLTFSLDIFLTLLQQWAICFSSSLIYLFIWPPPLHVTYHPSLFLYGCYYVPAWALTPQSGFLCSLTLAWVSTAFVRLLSSLGLWQTVAGCSSIGLPSSFFSDSPHQAVMPHLTRKLPSLYWGSELPHVATPLAPA